MGKKLPRNHNNKAGGKTAPQRRASSTTRGSENKAAFSIFRSIEHEILSRLPVKSLLRCRSVCKQWRSIIDDPSFVDVHASRSQTSPGSCRMLISFSELDGSKHYFFSANLRGGPAVNHITLPGCNKGSQSPCQCNVSESLNGLVLFSNGTELYICNPSRQSVQTLPPSSAGSWYEKLDCHLNSPFSSYSFGFDPSTKEYKVLHIIGICHRTDMKLSDVQCEVLTVKANLGRGQIIIEGGIPWRRMSRVPPFPYPFRSQGVCVNGAIHWIGISGPGQEILVAFDVASEKFRMTALPVGVSSKANLTQIGGRLALLGDKGYDTFSIELWVLKEYHNTLWVKQSVAFPHLKKQAKNPLPLGTVHTGEIFLVPDVLLHTYLVIPYQKTTVKKIKITRLPEWIELHGEKNINFSITNHVESFLPLENKKTLQFGDLVFYVDT
ncbi:hypothetical protein L1049_006061 [Liquidambar formosana]|uniref:F-box domain-containing protein n=1 Tax=Liquidambar formosana TaxID=63359 RepID=A0AAP0RGF6_LIQFO